MPETRESVVVSIRVDPAVALLLDLDAERAGMTRSRRAAHHIERSLLERRTR